VNYAGSYTDNSGATLAPIASLTTVDLRVAYTVPDEAGLTIGISCTNLFDTDPPYVVGTGQQQGIHFDVSNADPLGRVVVIDTRLKW